MPIEDALHRHRPTSPRRDYYYQALELIGCCDELGRRPLSDSRLDHQALNEIRSAAEEAFQIAVKEEHTDASATIRAFENATNKLESQFPDLTKRMRHAKAKDKDYMNKSWYWRALEELSPSPGRKVKVEILLCEMSLTNPASRIPEVFDDHVKLHEVLWNLLQRKDVTLKENPHFFDLPADSAEFNIRLPLESLRPNQILKEVFPENSPGIRYLYVLKDRQHRIVVRCCNPPRSLGNIWKFGRTIILKDHSSLLEAFTLIPKRFHLSNCDGDYHSDCNQKVLMKKIACKDDCCWFIATGAHEVHPCTTQFSPPAVQSPTSSTQNQLMAHQNLSTAGGSMSLAAKPSPATQNLSPVPQHPSREGLNQSRALQSSSPQIAQVDRLPLQRMLVPPPPKPIPVSRRPVPPPPNNTIPSSVPPSLSPVPQDPPPSTPPISYPPPPSPSPSQHSVDLVVQPVSPEMSQVPAPTFPVEENQPKKWFPRCFSCLRDPSLAPPVEREKTLPAPQTSTQQNASAAQTTSSMVDKEPSIPFLVQGKPKRKSCRCFSCLRDPSSTPPSLQNPTTETVDTSPSRTHPVGNSSPAAEAPPASRTASPTQQNASNPAQAPS